MKSKKLETEFDEEQPTQPSATSPLRSGRHKSFREPSIEEVNPPARTQARRRYSSEQPTVRRPTPSDLEEDEEAAPTPRPRVLFTHVPRVIMHETELVLLPLRAPAGFILGHIDGKTNVQTLIDISGMETQEVLRLLDELLLFGAISVK